MDADLAELRDAHERFLGLVRELRPELHRYCARMTGSVVDGEDIVQDTLAHAFVALASVAEMPALRPWLFRIAHNRALDFLRRYEHRMRDPFPAEEPPAGDALVDEALDAQLATRAALAEFATLPPSQRACVILKDVLGHSSAEIGEILGLGVGAVDACLHRGRARLRARARHHEARTPAAAPDPTIERYAALFQARDWDGVRALLAEDVQLDLVGHTRRAGAGSVGTYYSNYGHLPPFRVAHAHLEGRAGLAFYAAPADVEPAYVITLEVRDGAIAAIRDYRFVPYLLADARVTPNGAFSGR